MSANHMIEEIIGMVCLEKMKLRTLPVKKWEASIGWMIKAMDMVIKHSSHDIDMAYGRVKVFAPETEDADILGLVLGNADPIDRAHLLWKMATGWLF
jgi:hypothetical protein